MIVNESLPLIADQVLGNGVQSVAICTVLIVLFAEVIPQSLFTRHGLYLGAKGAGLTRCLMFALVRSLRATNTPILFFPQGIIAWPIAKLLEFVLGAHHGVIYRRAELKELIAMHSSAQHHGGGIHFPLKPFVLLILWLRSQTRYRDNYRCNPRPPRKGCSSSNDPDL
jgi:metal transporter CNNM